MNTLILYYSKHGVTKKVARLLNTQIKESELSLITSFEGDLDEFDTIYLGSPTYMGKLNKEFLSFLKKNKEMLFKKNVKIFIVGMKPEEFETLLANNFTKDEVDKYYIRHVGGGYNFNSMNFLERFIVKRVDKVRESKENINEDLIKEMAN